MKISDGAHCGQGARVLAGGQASGAATLEDSLTVSYEADIVPPYDPTTVLLGIYPTDVKTHVHIKTCTSTLQKFIHKSQSLKAMKTSLRG